MNEVLITRMKRVSWDEYFLNIAQQVSTRATCDRLHAGAVIVMDRRILSTGYNGSLQGAPHCDDEGHMMENDHCVRTIHAEANAVVQAAKNGVRVEGSTLYCNYLPCWHCFKLVANAGVKRIVFRESYKPDSKVLEHAKILGIELVSQGNN